MILLIWLIVVFTMFHAAFKISMIITNINYSTGKPLTVPILFQDAYTINDLIRSRQYLLNSLTISVCSVTVYCLLNVFLLLEGVEYLWIICQITSNLPLNATVFACLIYSIYYLVSLTLSVWKTFGVEKRFGFTNITFRIFVFDSLKVLSFNSIIIALAVSVTVLIVESFYLWFLPLISFFVAAWFALSSLLSKIRLSLFYELKPLEGPLMRSFEELAVRAGYDRFSVKIIDSSTRTNHVNAFLASDREGPVVILFDTLFDKFSDEEITSIFAHELGHAVNHDSYRWLSHVLFLFIFTFMWFIIEQTHLFNDGFLQFVYSLYLVYPFIWLLMIPVRSNQRRREFDADNYAVAVLGEDAVVRSLKKLFRLNLSNLDTDHLFTKLYSSHPDPVSRITRIEKAVYSGSSRDVR